MSDEISDREVVTHGGRKAIADLLGRILARHWLRHHAAGETSRLEKPIPTVPGGEDPLGPGRMRTARRED